VRLTVIALVSIGFFAPTAASADVVTYDVKACVDDSSWLIVWQGTLQWFNLGGRVPGNPVTCSDPNTYISTTLNGSPVVTNAAWTPAWHNPGDLTNPWVLDSSYGFFGVSPALPFSPFSVTLDVIQARGYLWITQLPTMENGGYLMLAFSDLRDGSATYEGLVTIDTTGPPPPPPPAPEPSAYLFLGVATAGLILLHVKKRGGVQNQ
jgi:hypothetical protein